MFCEEAVTELRESVRDNPDYPEVLFIYPASRPEGEEFFGSAWPEARAISDAEGRLYKDFGVSKAKLREVLGPGVWFTGLRALRKGYSPKRPVGNPWLLPAVFLVRGGAILREWKAQHIGDNPDFKGISTSEAWDT